MVVIFLLVNLIFFKAYAVALKLNFTAKNRLAQVPELILVAGCTGSGKSTLAMSLALNKGILKCISTDTVRQVMRTMNESPELQRSSYGGSDDAVCQWKDCSQSLRSSIHSLVLEAVNRGVSLIIEGVHLIPSNELIDLWCSHGGKAVGCLLVIDDEDSHRKLIAERPGVSNLVTSQQLKSFLRIRQIQSEMISLAKQNNWLQIEQNTDEDLLNIIIDKINKRIYSSSL